MTIKLTCALILLTLLSCVTSSNIVACPNRASKCSSLNGLINGLECIDSLPNLNQQGEFYCETDVDIKSLKCSIISVDYKKETGKILLSDCVKCNKGNVMVTFDDYISHSYTKYCMESTK